MSFAIMELSFDDMTDRTSALHSIQFPTINMSSRSLFLPLLIFFPPFRPTHRFTDYTNREEVHENSPRLIPRPIASKPNVIHSVRHSCATKRFNALCGDVCK